MLDKNGILIDLTPKDKSELLSTMGGYIASLYEIRSADTIIQKILSRESEMSTGIGYGIAIPHGRVEGIDRLHMIAARLKHGIEFEAIDEQPVSLIFMMISPPNTSADHTHILSSLSRVMSYEEVRNDLMEAASAQEFLSILINAESKYVE